MCLKKKKENEIVYVLLLFPSFIKICNHKLLYDKLQFCALLNKTVSTSTWDCTPDRIYGK
jgi:hypothetical protein